MDNKHFFIDGEFIRMTDTDESGTETFDIANTACDESGEVENNAGEIAKFIVKAANSHDALVDTLRNAVAAFKTNFEGADGSGYFDVEAAEAALKNAE